MYSVIKLFASLLLFFFSSLILGDINGVESSNQHHHLYGPTRLFVFGDSFADTGNILKPKGVSWRFPYGITFPGKPSGRFSDGHVSTDFLVKLLRIEPPVTYHSKDYAGKKGLQHGMNFAYGGTGVFSTRYPFPNMTGQIDLFEQLLGDVYSPSDLSSSLAFVSIAGNDYSHYFLNSSVFLTPAFIKIVVHQTEVNLKRIHALGVKKIAISSLPPLGGFPVFSKPFSHQNCINILNVLVKYHNRLLKKVVAKLNKNTKHSTFVIIDFYKAFLKVLKKKGGDPGSLRFKTLLKPCCGGDCSKIDAKGVKKYTLCDHPNSAFFWDKVHPTQQGWKSIYSVLRKTLTASLTEA